MDYPVVNTEAGPCHTFRNLVKPVAAPFKFELVAADVQVFDPEPPTPEPDLFNWAKAEAPNG